MMDLQIGDWAIVRVDVTSTIIFDVEFYDDRYSRYLQKEYLVIGRGPLHYCLLTNIDGSVEVTDNLIKLYSIDPFYKDIDCYVVRKIAVGGRRPPNYQRDALTCRLCQSTVPYALPNLSDRRSFICWSCRNDPRNSYRIERLNGKETKD